MTVNNRETMIEYFESWRREGTPRARWYLLCAAQAQKKCLAICDAYPTRYVHERIGYLAAFEAAEELFAKHYSEENFQTALAEWAKGNA
jgi:hypothetical protein